VPAAAFVRRPPAFARSSPDVKEGEGIRGNRDGDPGVVVSLSYLDDRQQPIGYHIDVCNKIVDAVKTQLKMPASR